MLRLDVIDSLISNGFLIIYTAKSDTLLFDQIRLIKFSKNRAYSNSSN